MKYLALIYTDENQDMAAPQEKQQEILNEYIAYEGWLAQKQAGKKIAGDALLPTATAKTIRVRNGNATVTDGPFAETKEHLGGYYLFDAKNIEEAIELAKGIPSAKVGCVEVRPIMVFD